MRADGDERSGGRFVLVLDFVADIGPTERLVLLDAGQPAEQLETGVVEHGHVVAHVHVSHSVAHPWMRDADKGDHSVLVLVRQNATSLPTLNFRISRASSGVATSSDSSPRMRLFLATCSALLLASWPLPIWRLSSRPTRTLPPMIAPMVHRPIWWR